MHDPADVEQTVTRFVEEQLLLRRPGLELNSDSDLIDSGIVDSVGLFRLVAHLEDTYGFAIPPDSITPENLGSIDAICRFVCERQARA